MIERAPAGRATARGAVKIGTSMATAAAAGLIIHIVLARTLQPELYGALAVVTSVIVWWESASSAFLAQATERMVAAAGDAWGGVAGTSVRLSLATGVLLAAALWAGAPAVADVLGDARLTAYVRLMTPDIPLFVLWATWLAVLNGRRRYGGRAFSTIAYWVAKAVLMCGLVALGLSVPGAIIGSIGASVVGLIVAWALAGVGLPPAGFPARKLIAFGLPLMALALVDRFVMSMDLWAVKALVDDADAAGLYGIGKYGFDAAMMLPYAVCGAAFPTLTRAIVGEQADSIRELIGESSRFTLLLIAPLIAIMACSGRELLTLVFGAPYAPAATALVALLIAALLSGLRQVANTTLIADNRPGLVLAIAAPLAPLNLGLNYALVSSHGLMGAAAATGITFLCAAGPVWWFVWRRFGVLPSVLSATRIAVAAGATYAAGLLLPAEGWPALLQAAGLALLYLLILGALRELKPRDLEPLAFWR